MKILLEEKDLLVRHTYRAKRFKEILGFTNDRIIVWIGRKWDEVVVQYDSDTVGIGRHLPTVSAAKFLRWAARDVTDELKKPAGNKPVRRGTG